MVKRGGEKIRLKVDLEELCFAFEDASMEHRYYLDLETGEVLYISDEIRDEEMERLDEIVEEGFGKRYISIPHTSSDEGYRDMEGFIGTVNDKDLKEKLYIAIDGGGAFRRFKDVLLSYLEERERWFKFKEARVRERVKEWLQEEGIQIEELDKARKFHAGVPG